MIDLTSTAPVNDPEYGTTDPVWPEILATAGSDVIYRAAAGLEKAMADVDAGRLISTYAELVSDQWDAYSISYRNLPYLAWASGCNLWEESWSEGFKRYWVANQMTFQSQRGSLLGISNFVNAVGAEVLSAVVPPASFYPNPSQTPAQTAAYVARFPQLRLYPYAPTPVEPYLCFPGNFVDPVTNEKVFNKNGCFLGPLQMFYPTNYNAGGQYFQDAVLWDQGVSTNLTVQQWTQVDVGTQQDTLYTQVTMPGISDDHFFMGRSGKYFLPAGHPVSQNKYGIFLGALYNTADHIALVPQNVDLTLFEAKAIYQTVLPGLQPLEVTPENVASVHQSRITEFYCGQCLAGKFQPPSNAWQFMYQLWYLFDPTVVPANKKASCFMGQARFGIGAYTAELKIAAYGIWPRFYLRAGGFLNGFLPPKNTSVTDKIRRAVTASMALRDTVGIDTYVMRVVQISDAVLADGNTWVGMYIES